jgi:hypothetical protein
MDDRDSGGEGASVSYTGFGYDANATDSPGAALPLYTNGFEYRYVSAPGNRGHCCFSFRIQRTPVAGGGGTCTELDQGCWEGFCGTGLGSASAGFGWAIEACLGPNRHFSSG